ncbi:hypothetical protein BH09ACT6_BH09ACT6_03760 [soil metagenome]
MGDTDKKLRADTQKTRDKLLDVLGRMLQTHGPSISLPALAKEAGVSTATVYRHFDDVYELREEFYERILQNQVDQFRALSEIHTGIELFQRICETWIDIASAWARAATFIRSPEGFLERLKAHDRMVTRFDDVLRPVVVHLIETGVLPEQNLDYAILVWITLFDERVIIDLEAALGWNSPTIARTLAATTLSALGHSS